MLIAGILLFPLLGFLLNALLLNKASKKVSGLIAVGACVLSFISALIYTGLFGFQDSKSFELMEWINVGALKLSFSFAMDSLSLLMVLLITGVGFLIHLYSFFYMFKDSGFTKYFAYLNLFVFMMLILVLADNLPLLFVGWEGVGLCSYLLIGFSYKDQKKVHSGMTAFIANRIGDACFLLGIFILFFHLKTFHFSGIHAFFNNPENLIPPELAFSALLIFLGATGKSAQFPLYFWLPRAMAGPTPVSALIHAATMVTAGVYLLVRLSSFYSAFPQVLSLIGWVGALTALGAALMATQKNDFKAVLAYSTVSQLAYLFMALSVKAFSAGIFHLLTHGFFKALLFLCAGSVIHALRGEQNIKKMGGLKSQLPITFFTYMAGALALIALPPFSGFFSKDEILWSLFSSGQYALFGLALGTGWITCFYMTRLSFYVFFGKAKAKANSEELGLNIPLYVLAFFAIFAGFLGFPHLFSEVLSIPHFLHEILIEISPQKFKGELWKEGLLMALSVSSNLLVIAFSYQYYQKNKKLKIPKIFKQILARDFLFPEKVEIPTQRFFTRFSYKLFDKAERGFFKALPLFLASQVLVIKKELSKLNNGSLSFYLVSFSLGLSFLLIFMFLR